MKLGMDRAEAVRKELVSLGIPAERLSTVTFGESQPLFAEKEDWARAANRRVETHVDDAAVAAPPSAGAPASSEAPATSEGSLRRRTNSTSSLRDDVLFVRMDLAGPSCQKDHRRSAMMVFLVSLLTVSYLFLLNVRC